MSKRRLFLAFTLIVLLSLRFIFFYQTQPLYHDGDRVSLHLTLQDEPTITGQSQQISVKTARGQQLIIKTDTTISLGFGQVITVSGIVKEKQGMSGKKMFILYYPKI